MLSKDVSIVNVTFIVSFSIFFPLCPVNINRKTIIEYVSVLCSISLGKGLYNFLTTIVIYVGYESIRNLLHFINSNKNRSNGTISLKNFSYSFSLLFHVFLEHFLIIYIELNRFSEILQVNVTLFIISSRSAFLNELINLDLRVIIS